MEGGAVGHNFERDPPCQVWFNLVQWFQRKRFKCDLLSKYLHNRYKSAERKISQKNPEYMLNYSFPSSCSRRRFKCESLQRTTDGRTDDDGRQVMAKAVLRNFDIQTFVIKTGNLLVRGKLSFPF